MGKEGRETIESICHSLNPSWIISSIHVFSRMEIQIERTTTCTGDNRKVLESCKHHRCMTQPVSSSMLLIDAGRIVRSHESGVHVVCEY